MITIKCTRNQSRSLPYFIGSEYQAKPLPGGVFEIQDGNGSHIIAPLDGHYVEFELVPADNKKSS